MAGTVGPSTWWIRSKEAADYYARICPVGTILGDGSAIWCNAGGQAWIIAPYCTEVVSQWADGKYNNTFVNDSVKMSCIVLEWPTLCSRLLSCGFNPCDWFVPSRDILVTAWACRSRWDTCTNANWYWSTTEYNSTQACGAGVNDPTGWPIAKTYPLYTRAIRCVRI